MQLNLDISSLESTTDTSLTPPVNQTKLMTEMIVRDGQTVVMGGLIDDLETGNRQSVPLLGKIPLLRHLFSNKSSTTSRNELVVMITPKVIDSEKKSIEVSKEFSEKIHREYQKYIQDEM
jgi:general secretion pathway protein D